MSHDVELPQDPRVASLTLARSRNLRALTAILADLDGGELVEATFRSDLYGPFMIHGRVVRSRATDGLLVAGHFLDTTTAGTPKPAPDLFALAPAADLPTQVTPTACIANIEHGDIVEARFEQQPYGQFVITGFAVHAPVAGDTLIVGGWYLSGREPGSAAPRLLEVQIVADTCSHQVRTPGRIDRWPTQNTDSR